MQIQKRTISHQDSRGTLTDIFEKTLVNSCVIVTQKKGSIRGNHVHKKTIQYTYVLKGSLYYYVKKPRYKVERKRIASGDFVTSPAGHAHAFEALEASVMIACAYGPRGGKSYESDTYRLPHPLNEIFASKRHKLFPKI